jgi:hypothetical protein
MRILSSTARSQPGNSGQLAVLLESEGKLNTLPRELSSSKQQE